MRAGGGAAGAWRATTEPAARPARRTRQRSRRRDNAAVMARPDVLLVSLGGTAGLRAADDALAASMRRGGASVALARVAHAREPRTLALTDLAWAVPARRAAAAALREARPRAIVYSSTTAALLWPEPGAIRFDAPAAGNRPGRHGVWQRPVERRRFAAAPLLLPWSAGALAEAPARRAPALVVPVPVAPSGPAGERDIEAITYGANPEKKGLDRVLAAWAAARRPGETLVVAGVGGVDADGVRFAGMLSPIAYRALLRRARVFVTAPRREDYGIAQLEALADGCVLVSTAAPGPYAALPVARELDARLVGDDLVAALRVALDAPPAAYAERARELLMPWSPDAVDELVRERLLPALLNGGHRGGGSKCRGAA
jgi:glycosyltransferase involved in cell wall biosynthesis